LRLDGLEGGVPGRRTVAVRDIDSNSTERVNQERGTPLQLPL